LLDYSKSIAGITKKIDADILFDAYSRGIFPWYNEDEGDPVIWWSPEPRFVLLPEDFHAPRRVTRFLKNTPYTYTVNAAFERVMRHCADAERPGQDGTWIGDEMIEAYTEFHRRGFALSVEAWHEGRLAGGFYGVLLGSLFSGESMFSLLPETSKSAFVLFMGAFIEAGGLLVDSQVYTENIARFGAKEIPRREFVKLHKKAVSTPLNADERELFVTRLLCYPVNQACPLS
jgi:leucyl/phenylalanyl-tRNA--protein transferase